MGIFGNHYGRFGIGPYQVKPTGPNERQRTVGTVRQFPTSRTFTSGADRRSVKCFLGNSSSDNAHPTKTLKPLLAETSYHRQHNRHQALFLAGTGGKTVQIGFIREENYAGTHDRRDGVDEFGFKLRKKRDYFTSGLPESILLIKRLQSRRFRFPSCLKKALRTSYPFPQKSKF